MGKAGTAKMIRRYREDKAKCLWTEKRRPKLLEKATVMIGSLVDADYDKACKIIDSTRLSNNDKNMLKSYIKAKIRTDVTETAVYERLDESVLPIAEDIFIEVMKVNDIAEKYEVNEKTVRRIRDKGIEAIFDEITLRTEAGNDLSSVF